MRTRLGRLGEAAALVAALTAVLTAGLVVSSSVPSSAANPAGVQVTVTPSSAAPGTSIDVTFENVPSSTVYEVQVCGDDAVQGSVDCDTANSVTGVAGVAGYFGVTLTVSTPPAPCPCVVAAFTSKLPDPITGPINLIGAPYAPVTGQLPGNSLDVVQVSLQGTKTASEWFGAAPKRTLVLTLRNPYDTDVTGLPIVMSYRRGSGSPTPVAAPTVGTVAPGQTTVVRVPVTFPALALGTYSISGHVGAGGSYSTFGTSTYLGPWGLIGSLGLAALIVLLLVLRSIRLSIRRRRRRKAARAAKLAAAQAAKAAAGSSPPASQGAASQGVPADSSNGGSAPEGTDRTAAQTSARTSPSAPEPHPPRS
jgi:hypothetical protein